MSSSEGAGGGRTPLFINLPKGWKSFTVHQMGDCQDNFDQFLDRTCPMNETDINTAQAQSDPANYAREVLVRELMTWRMAVEDTTRRVNEARPELARQLKLQSDARQRVASLETALRTV